MRFIGFEREDEALAWAKEIIGISHPTGFCRALSAVDGDENLCFVIVLSTFTSRNVDFHLAAVPGGKWATPGQIVMMFNSVFQYIFDHLKAARATGLVRNKNTVAKRFVEHIGFTREGLMRNAFSDDDLCIYGFLAEDYLAHPWHRS